MPPSPVPARHVPTLSRVPAPLPTPSVWLATSTRSVCFEFCGPKTKKEKNIADFVFFWQGNCNYALATYPAKGRAHRACTALTQVRIGYFVVFHCSLRVYLWQLNNDRANKRDIKTSSDAQHVCTAQGGTVSMCKCACVCV